MDSELIMTRFHSIYEKLNRVLVKTPFDELRISDEVKDEVLFTLLVNNIADLAHPNETLVLVSKNFKKLLRKHRFLELWEICFY